MPSTSRSDRPSPAPYSGPIAGPYEANLVPIDESIFADVLLPFIIAESDAGTPSDRFEQLTAKAVRIRQVQLRTNAWKRALMLKTQASHSIQTGLETPTTQENQAQSQKQTMSSVPHVKRQVGGSNFSNSNDQQRATEGHEPPPAFSSHSSRQGESHSRNKKQNRDVDDMLYTCRAMFSRPFFIQRKVVSTYEQYLNANPNQVEKLARAAFPDLAGFNAQPNLAEATVPPRETPASDEVVRHEVTWKVGLLRDAFRNLGRLRAVFDSDGELYHPHQLLSEDSPMALVEFASYLHPGWSIDGPWNPSNLLPGDGFDGQGLFESPQKLFAALVEKVPALEKSLRDVIDGPYRVGAYVAPGNVERFKVALLLQRDKLKLPIANEIASQQRHAVQAWLEAAEYAHRHGLGLIECADLYNRKEGILN